jgi:hypothetical protein
MSFPHLSDQNERFSLSFKFNELLPLLFSPSPNDFSLFSLFSPFSRRHHLVFDHFMALTPIGSRMLFGFQENTETLEFWREILSKCVIRFARKNISNLFSNRNWDLLGIRVKSDFRLSQPYRPDQPSRPLSGRIFIFTIKTQESKKFTKIDKGIGKELLWRKFESNEIEGQFVYFGLSFCRFVEKVNCFEISKLGYIDVVLSTEWIFPDVSTFWSYFKSSLSFILQCNVDFNCNSNWKEEVMMRNSKSIYFVNTKDRTDCHPFLCNFVEEKQ